MQCSNCRFENMPGVEACGRCGSRVALKELDVDVHPPRAGAWSKRLRRWLPFRSAYYGARDASWRAQEGWFGGVLQIEAPNVPLGVLCRLIVPGWAQLHQGQRALGLLFLCGWGAFLLLTLLFYGSVPGSVFIGLAFSVHVSSCISILHRAGIDSRGFWVNTAVVFLGLLLCVYLPVGWLSSRLVSPVLIEDDYAPFFSGDVLLYSPAGYWWRAPRPGDVVVYRQRAVQYQLPAPLHTAVLIREGQRLDRILAVAGDNVEWKDGRLTVNGEASALQPLNPKVIIPKMTFVVPAGHYLILPTVGPELPGGLNVRGWRELALVDAEGIVGRVLVRSYPLTRWRRIS
jgi:signal peptidase I